MYDFAGIIRILHTSIYFQTLWTIVVERLDPSECVYACLKWVRFDLFIQLNPFELIIEILVKLLGFFELQPRTTLGVITQWLFFFWMEEFRNRALQQRSSCSTLQHQLWTFSNSLGMDWLSYPYLTDRLKRMGEEWGRKPPPTKMLLPTIWKTCKHANHPLIWNRTYENNTWRNIWK